MALASTTSPATRLRTLRARRAAFAVSELARATGVLGFAVAALALSTGFLGCVLARPDPPAPAERIAAAEAVARRGGLAPIGSEAESDAGLPIAAWARPGDSAWPLHVYIEGDGLAWRSRRRVSEDPTPVDPVGLALAIADPSPAPVLYLGRPCQYMRAPDPRCGIVLWTHARFGEAVVDAMDARLDGLSSSTGKDSRVVLIGYSGGGVVAALLAARRDDVDRLVTVAAPLDVERWTDTTQTSPLVGSLSPMQAIPALDRMPQVHLVGGADEIVPRAVTESFQAALSSSAPSRVVVVEGMDHRAWPPAWPALVERIEGFTTRSE